MKNQTEDSIFRRTTRVAGMNDFVDFVAQSYSLRVAGTE